MTGKNSVTEINDRRLKLQDIMAEYDLKGKPYTQAQLVKDLHKHKFDIDIRTLRRDLDAVNAGNDFVTKLATVNYSKFVETCFTKLDRIEDAALKIYKKKWTQSKKVTRVTPDGESEETVITAELAAPKIAAQKLMAEVQDMKLKAIGGNILDDSVAAMTKRFQDLQQQVAALEEENKSLKEQKGGPIQLAQPQN